MWNYTYKCSISLENNVFQGLLSVYTEGGVLKLKSRSK